MKSFRNLTALIVAALTFSACNKDKTLNYSSLEAGVTEMDITTVGMQISSTSFFVDFDNDGVDDLEFDSGLMAFGPMNQDKYGWFAIPLNENISFHTSSFQDTLFSWTDITLYSYPQIPSYTVLTVDRRGYIEPDTSFSILDIEQNARVKYLDHGESISNQNSFSEGILPLNIGQTLQNYWTDSISNDTTYMTGYMYSTYPPFWRGSESRYAIFKLSDGKTKDRLGWIKLTGLMVDEVAIEPK